MAGWDWPTHRDTSSKKRQVNLFPASRNSQVTLFTLYSLVRETRQQAMSHLPAIQSRQLDVSKAIRQAIKLHRQHELGEAEKLYTEILATEPDHFEALHLLGVLRLSQGKPLEAFELISRALAIDGHSWRALYNCGRVLLSLDRYEEAVARFELALANKPGQADVHFCHARALHKLNRLEDALASYDNAIAIQPDPGALYNRGNILLALRRYEEALGSYDKALAIRPDYVEAHDNRGIALYHLKRYEEALASHDRALEINPNYAEAHSNRGNTLGALGRHEEARTALDRALAIRPDVVSALYNRGHILLELERYEEALGSYDKALAIRPDYVEAHDNRGIALYHLKRYEEALASHDRALEINPNYAEAHSNRGNTLGALGRHEEALSALDQALAIRPDFVSALYNRGNVLDHLGLHAEALVSYNQALAINPNYVSAIVNRGNTLRVLNRDEEALAAFDQALTIKPDYVEAINNRGNVLRALNRHQEALACYDKALTIKPDFYQAHLNRGKVLRDLRRHQEAAASYDKALEIRPDSAEAHYGRGNALRSLDRVEEAIASLERAVKIDPDHRGALGVLASCTLAACDWEKWALLSREVDIHVAEARTPILPFVFLHYSGSPEAQFRCARNFFEMLPTDQSAQPMWRGEIYRHDKIRVAYTSADFHHHNTGYLMAELFEIHDRSRFEVIGVSFGPDDGSSMRKRLVKAFDQFHDVRESSDRETAELLRGLQADIVVDLKGYTLDCRPGILAHRPAPIHVNYLGYQGTMGTAWVDYIIGDEIALPFELQPYFTEQIVHIPVCHQANDSTIELPPAPTLSEAGLPEEGFVFCCFNDSAKITPLIFDIWMRLLDAVDRSVLWLMGDNALVSDNLCREASARRMDPARLVFAPFAPAEEHLRRHRVADIFLDTLPMNAHTSASRALWAGLPILTCTGDAFAGRISASLLQAAGLPELITHNLEDYEDLAKTLAKDPLRLQGFKRHLEVHRRSCSLFDTNRLRSNIEAAYTTMWEKYQRGEVPRSFSVASA